MDPTVWLSTEDMLGAKLALPEYCAVMGCKPALSDDVLYEAMPPVVSGVALPLIAEPLSKKVTVPVGVPVAELLTVAVRRTDWSTADGFGEELSAMNVGAVMGTEVGFTVCVTTFDVLGEKFASPAYTAVTGWDPTLSDDVVNVATPPLSGLVLIITPLSRKFTFPVGVPPPDGPFTLAVNVTACPAKEGFPEEARAVAEGRSVDCTTCVTAFDVVPAKVASPGYCAVIEWVPTLNDAVFNMATPLASSAPVPICVVPSMNVTVPVGTAGAPPTELTTIASNDTNWLVTEGSGAENSSVVVALPERT